VTTLDEGAVDGPKFTRKTGRRGQRRRVAPRAALLSQASLAAPQRCHPPRAPRNG
jgi:hypothetical protein